MHPRLACPAGVGMSQCLGAAARCLWGRHHDGYGAWARVEGLTRRHLVFGWLPWSTAGASIPQEGPPVLAATQQMAPVSRPPPTDACVPQAGPFQLADQAVAVKQAEASVRGGDQQQAASDGAVDTLAAAGMLVPRQWLEGQSRHLAALCRLGAAVLHIDLSLVLKASMLVCAVVPHFPLQGGHCSAPTRRRHPGRCRHHLVHIHHVQLPPLRHTPHPHLSIDGGGEEAGGVLRMKLHRCDPI
mmetsp:Transcript_924/g.2818  ORF Transcript_924/g.2818 Transcript_924/m.2818 type:complete len:243 (+) Transcript_924:1395-2123(+)